MFDGWSPPGGRQVAIRSPAREERGNRTAGHAVHASERQRQEVRTDHGKRDTPTSYTDPECLMGAYSVAPSALRPIATSSSNAATLSMIRSQSRATSDTSA